MWNQVYVGLGNIVGGALLVGAAYWMSSPYRVTKEDKPREMLTRL